MDSGARRRETIERLFEDALDQPAEARTAWLEEACAGDGQLLDAVRSLLAAHERSGVLDRGPAPTPTAADPNIGREIGPYRILESIGRGGMGAVYLAERVDGQYRRIVAIKLIRGDHDADQLHKRFLTERQILASLNHPNIASLLDGGITEDGMPYLVMEYVDGSPITKYCDRHRLDIESRLRLFRDVCAAVHSAHQNLIIHRDIKPGNVLVEESGRVKLVDFGIAKLLNPHLAPASAPMTAVFQRAFTPDYASPEQVRGEPLTTASDVYSLGILLYELLAGRQPYRIRKGTPDELIEVVCEKNPEPPSTRLARTETVVSLDGAAEEITPATVSQNRSTTAEHLRRRLRSDLDTIVMTALRKEPARRYASAHDLSQDIDRYLTGLPVAAHRDTMGYRLGKLIRRRRIESAAVAVVAVALVVATVLVLRQNAVARRERDRAEAARLRAESALQRSEEVTDFLVGLFEAADPVTTGTDTAASRAILRRGLELEARLVDQSVVRAEVLDALGRVYSNLADYTRARAALEQALDLRRAETGEDDAGVAEIMTHLAVVLRAQADYREADALVERALYIQMRTLGDADTAVARTLLLLSGSLGITGMPDSINALQRRALDIQHRALGQDHPAIANTLITLGGVARRSGRTEEAEQLYRDALAVQQRVFGPDAPEVAGSLLYLADFMAEDSTRFDEAERLYRNALAIQRAAWGNDYPYLSHGLENLADLLARQGRDEEAESLLREVLDLRLRVYGADNRYVASSYSLLGSQLSRQGQHEAGLELINRALRLQRQLFGEGSVATAGTLTALGEAYRNMGRYDQAVARYREALSLRERGLSPRHPLVGLTDRLLARILVEAGRPGEAERAYLDALDVYHSAYGDSHRDVRSTHGELADLYETMGRDEDAARHRAMADPSGS